MKNKFKSYSFWMSVTGAVILVLNNIGKACGFMVDDKLITEIIDSICGVLILFGVITISKSDKDNKDENEEAQNTQDELSKNLTSSKNKKNKDANKDD